MNDRTKNYVFISYSHANDISNLISAFDEKGYNVVFDSLMSYGEEWDLNARRYISSEKCRGVIIVLSEKSIISKAVLTEIEYTVQFKKKFFTVMVNDLTLLELYNSISDRLDENKKYILDSIMEYLSNEQLFVKLSALDWQKIETTFKSWGIVSNLTANADNIISSRYTSEINGEKERLQRQQRGYYEFDIRAINQVMNDFDRDDLCVLDLGCSDGSLTISRFADNPKIKKIIGVDYNPKDIERAKILSAEYGDKFKFYQADLEDSDIISKLNNILQENGINKVDIVFAALILHHLKNPKLLLLKLYDIFSDDGKIIIRSSDDGGKLCYPQTELLEEILKRYEKFTISDRTNGRKLYSLLYDTGYLNIKMLYSVTDTCEKDRKSKENLFGVGFGFRLNTLNKLIELNPDNEFLKSEKEWLSNALIKFKEAFCERDFWYCNTSYIAIAGVK